MAGMSEHLGGAGSVWSLGGGGMLGRVRLWWVGRVTQMCKVYFHIPVLREGIGEWGIPERSQSFVCACV